MNDLRNHLIILSFAALHGAMALFCRAIGVQDELILTLLTMLMLALLCYHRRMDIEFTAVAIVVGNLVGYALGLGFVKLTGRFSEVVSSPWPAAISTAVTTLILGYLTIATTSFLAPSDRHRESKYDIIWIVGAISLVFLARLTVILLHRRNILGNPQFGEGILYFMTSCVALMFVLFAFLASYTLLAKRKTEKEIEKRHLAQYRYMKLSQQVNPHFLFNSLNILDGLVTEGDSEAASVYIHKLAALYRYLLKNEDETLVRLRDEMEFVDKYIDLLKVRFQDGMEVTEDIDPSSLGHMVVPCSVQLLIENATKHNAALAGNPLKIRITTDSGKICVSNTLRPKLSPPNSTGLGLKYISQQYKDLSGKEITITQTDAEFTVILPLL